MISKREVPCPPYCLAVHTWGLITHLSKGRLFSICLLALLTSFFLALHIVFLGYPRTPLVCLDSARYIPQDVESMRVRFPRTKRRLPQCIIIGVRKCGTRALLEFLNLHPSIQKASDEVHFFDEDDKYKLGLEWYRRRMPYSFPDQITIEKSPAYFITDSAPARIRAMNESVRLLLIVRDPVTRLISDYAQLAANKAKKDKALASFEDLVFMPNGQINTAYKAVRISMYSIFYEKWHRLFPRRQIHIVDGDDLIRDPFPEVQRIEEFLGIAHRISKENFFYNKTKGFYCVRNETTEKCLNESKGRRHPIISDQVIHKLRQFYAPYNKMFFRAAGRDFGWPEE
ncbi:heparan sulfate glucosamine 3-O-sulfotransferase 1-like [Parasteatoda tepidariorum]|uniref:heparan sulfate glucosamine 3-O-sulfotransferase 1-like n=1 Tax=Parasteatoda tepidariorum TaxID=114398 RepID=UPI00077F9B9E|nr:heparan sulfate glucosamine 3-O-sulfotransferase 1-like [Parasteatoda tepidariorum]